MSTGVDCSIIIVNYNTPLLTLECLASVYGSQDGRYSYEVIVVDNASRDDSVAQIENLFPNCRLIANKHNLGFAKANNQAVKVAKGRYFLLLNSDTIVSPGSIDASLAYMEEHPDAGVVGCRLYYPDGSHQHSIARLPTIKNTFDEYIMGKMTAWYNETDYETSMEVGSVIGAFFLVSRKAVDAVGLFDERYFMNVEDVDWCKRMWDAGFRVLYLSEVSIIHIGSQSIKKHKKTMNWELQKNRVKYFRKHHGIFSALIVMAFIVLSSVKAKAVDLKKNGSWRLKCP
jgi:GT2 family glycosyltransferase